MSKCIHSVGRVVAFSAAVFLAGQSASAGITHRYSFTEPGKAKDSVGKLDGVLKNAAQVANGKLTLANEDKTSGDEKVSYLEFPSSLLPAGKTVSLVVWFAAGEQGNFSRVLDIGAQDGGDGSAFIYFTPRNGDDQARVAISRSDAAGKTAIDVDRLDNGSPHMIAIVIDGEKKTIQLFIDGKSEKPSENLGENTLDSVRPQHTWLGRSGFDNDAGFTGSIEEFRVYDNALTADEIAQMQKDGPDKTAAVPSTQPASK